MIVSIRIVITIQFKILCMKNIILVLLISFFWSSAIAQAVNTNPIDQSSKTNLNPADTLPHYNDEYIHIIGLDSNEVAFLHFGHFLIDNNIPIENSSKDFLSINTVYTEVNNKEQVYALRLITSIKNSNIKIRVDADDVIGKIVPNYRFTMYYSSNIFKKTWMNLLQVLRKYPHSRIYFTKQ